MLRNWILQFFNWEILNIRENVYVFEHINNKAMTSRHRDCSLDISVPSLDTFLSLFFLNWKFIRGVRFEGVEDIKEYHGIALCHMKRWLSEVFQQRYKLLKCFEWQGDYFEEN